MLDIDRLDYMFGTIELWNRFRPLFDGRDAICFKPVAKLLATVFDRFTCLGGVIEVE